MVHQPPAADHFAMAMNIAGLRGLDRDLALFRLAVELEQNLHAHEPHPMPERPLELVHVQLEQLAALCEKQTAFATLFARYRAAITELEGQNAGRVQVIAGTIRMLHELRERQPDVRALPTSEAMVEKLKRFLLERWRIVPPSARIRDLRAWSQATTRRYDLLPVSWRYV